MNQESGIMVKKNKIISIIHDSLFMIHSRGFTFIELMVAVSIMAVLGALSIAGFASYNQAQILQASSSDVVVMLNLAKSRAQSQIKPSTLCPNDLRGYTVVIISSPSTYRLELNCSNESNNIVPGQDKRLPQDLSFRDNSSFFFPVQTGGVQNPGQIIIESGGNSKNIMVNDLGGVSVQ